MLHFSGCISEALHLLKQCLQTEHPHSCDEVKERPLWKILHEVQRRKQHAKSLLSKALQTASFHSAESVNQGIAPRIFLH